MQKVSSGGIKGILFFVVFIIVISIMGCLIFSVGILAVTILPTYYNAGLVEGMEIIKNDPAVAEMFGSPIRHIPIILGEASVNAYGSGGGSLTTFISGPKGRGDVSVHVSKPEGGDWQVDSMSIRVNRNLDRNLDLYWDASERVKGFHVLPPRIPTSEVPTYEEATPPSPPTQVPPAP